IRLPTRPCGSGSQLWSTASSFFLTGMHNGPVLGCPNDASRLRHDGSTKSQRRRRALRMSDEHPIRWSCAGKWINGISDQDVQRGAFRSAMQIDVYVFASESGSVGSFSTRSRLSAVTTDPLLFAHIAASVRLWTRMFRKIALTWTFTVASANAILRAIVLLESP